MTPEQETRLKARLTRRHRAETRFRWYGRVAIGLAVLALVYLLVSIITPGLPGFIQYGVNVPLTADVKAKAATNPTSAAIAALQARLGDMEADRRARRELAGMLSSAAAGQLAQAAEAGESEAFLLLDDAVDQYLKRGVAAGLSERQVGWIEQLGAQDHISSTWNSWFFTRGDSREPEIAGFWGSMVGSFFALAVCLCVSLFLGVLSAIYLEEFAPNNMFTRIIEVNINNLAAVPSIIFGLLGLAVFLNFFELSRSSALVGGLTLALMTLPVIIISARVALKAVPPSLREAARGLGASRLQVVAHHVLPYSLPGIMTGAILGMARAIGETAPLLMIGMVAFIVDVPGGLLDPATAMPVQIYIWASSPEIGFIEKTSTGSIVLLMMLLAMNATAIYLRRKFEIKW